MKRALLLDRDGTLIIDRNYPRDPALVEPLVGAIDVLRELQQTFRLVIISNQSGIGRGLITEIEAKAVHARLIEVFAGVTFAGAYYCPHVPEANCRCRKPAPGMIEDAARELELDLAGSVMIGDKVSDVEAGRAAGVGQLLGFGPSSGATDGVTDWAAVRRILVE